MANGFIWKIDNQESTGLKHNTIREEKETELVVGGTGVPFISRQG
jgi:hypothetical protein